MLVIDKVNVMNIENAIRGARNPMNSWDKSDSYYDGNGNYILGDNDIKLATSLCKAGSDHRKFLRQIFITVDILAPMYWWKEFDTYKVGTTSNSTSTMHKIHSKPFDINDFSYDRMNEQTTEVLKNIVLHLEELRIRFNEIKDKEYWYSIIQLLPSSYNQLRTCTMTYENIRSIYSARKNHKLDEWKCFCSWIETLPYAKELVMTGKA